MILHGSGDTDDRVPLHRLARPHREESASLRGHPARISNAATARPNPSTVREELGKYRGTRRCPECSGARLNPTARHVHVAGTTLPEATRLSVANAMQHFAQLAGERLARRDRGAHRQGSGGPAALPGRRGPRLPHARPQRRDTVRRRGAAHPSREPGGLGTHRRALHPRRAFDRPAPARQPAPARDAASGCAISATRCSWSSTTTKPS